MNINKAQGQSPQVCGMNLENPCFSHGQLYVACSSVRKPSDLFVHAPERRTKNIVYPNAFQYCVPIKYIYIETKFGTKLF